MRARRTTRARAPGRAALPLGLAALTAAALVACSAQPAPTPAPASESGAEAPPTSPRATLSVEPPLLRIGDVATLELLVATPPGDRVLPLVPPAPADLPGLWLLDVETLPPEPAGGRTLHRTRLRVRPRDVGEHAFPPLEVVVEDPAGRRQRLEVPGRDIEVVSVLPQQMGRSEPFGLLEPPDRPAPARALLWAAGGAAGALGVLAAARLARRIVRRRANGRDGRERRAAPPPTQRERAEARLRAALSRASAEPRDAADEGSEALRRWVAARFARDGGCATTEELAAATPPTGARAAWPAFVRLLRELDAIRFRPEPLGGERGVVADRLRATLEEALRFVDDTLPPGSAGGSRGHAA